MAFEIVNNYVNSPNSIYFIGEIGINHNGDINLAKKIMKEAKSAGFSAVKFQKRNPEITTPLEVRNNNRETPWGEMTYIDYKFKIELQKQEYDEINKYAKELGIDWFASCWDESSVDFMEELDIPCYKIASASVTNLDLLKKISKTKRPVMMSTGMSTMKEIQSSEKFSALHSRVLVHLETPEANTPHKQKHNRYMTIKTANDYVPQQTGP